MTNPHPAALTPEQLRKVLSYDPDTGVFTWIAPKSRNVRIGQVAGRTNPQGYVQIQIFRRLYQAHRLAWLYVYGEWPSTALDHINRDRSDNRTKNLRLASISQNGANRSINRNNTSGVKGVCWRSDTRKWQAQIRVGKRTKYLGVFENIEDASAAYAEAAMVCFGEFSARSTEADHDR